MTLGVISVPYPAGIVGRTVVLRDFRIEDVGAALAVVGDDRVTRSLSFDSRNRDQATAMIAGAIDRARQDPRSAYYLAVELPESDEPIGFARLGLDGVQAAKLGYAVRADQWGICRRRCPDVDRFRIS